MISFRQTGDFSRVNGYLERLREAIKLGQLDKYGKLGVEALSAATPVNTGKTASSWYYEIIRLGSSVRISFYNSNKNQGVPIAIILQYGHGTGTGGWVQGTDYINPAITPIFEEIANQAWEEVKRI